MPLKIFHSVLPFAVLSLVQIFYYPGSCQLRPFEVRVNVFDEDRKALSLVPDLGGAGASWPGAMEHDPGIAEMHLRPGDPARGFAVPVMLGKTKGSRQPNERIGNIVIRDVRQYSIRRHRAVLQHRSIVLRAGNPKAPHSPIGTLDGNSPGHGGESSVKPRTGGRSALRWLRN